MEKNDSGHKNLFFLKVKPIFWGRGGYPNSMIRSLLEREVW